MNDDYTPMEYVVKLLRAVFNKSESDAVNIMLMVHNKGAGVCGIFTKDIAETKVFTVLKMAKHDQHPLKWLVESHRHLFRHQLRLLHSGHKQHHRVQAGSFAQDP